MAARAWLVPIALAIYLGGCLDRGRVNEECRWSVDGAGRLDLGDRAQLLHLYRDVELAEELAIRHADRVFQDRHGVYAHGGLIEGGRLRDRCMARLLSAVAASHGLSVQRVVEARARGYRDPRWDRGVLLAFAGMYGFLAWAAVRLLARHIPVDEGAPELITTLIASVPIGFLGFQAFRLWAAALEAFRLGNGHVSSYRAARPPWPAYGAELMLAAVAIFLLVFGLDRVVRKYESAKVRK